VFTLVRTIFEQPDATSVRAQHAQSVTALEAKLPQAAADVKPVARPERQLDHTNTCHAPQQ
jgi:hypothetical protein